MLYFGFVQSLFKERKSPNLAKSVLEYLSCDMNGVVYFQLDHSGRKEKKKSSSSLSSSTIHLEDAVQNLPVAPAEEFCSPVPPPP